MVNESQSNLLVEHEVSAGGGRYAIARFCNPGKLNSLDSRLIKAATVAFRKIASDEDLTAVVVTGDGDRAFIGGADLNTMSSLDADGARRFITSIHDLCQSILSIPVPVIGRINGFCLGAGLEIAACCDYRISARTSQFGMPEVHVGIPSVIEAARLPLLIGWGRTRELLLTGRWIEAEEAHSIGLVEILASSDSLDRTVRGSVDLVAKGGPKAVRLQKALIDRWEHVALDEAVEAGIESFSAAYETDEPQTYMQRFLKQRRGA